ncbi:NAD-dependent epimerase/dehydratase family protein [Fibrobacterota bacterium]
MPSVAGKKIVLIGGAGFIGHNLALALAGKQAEVHIIDGLEVNNVLSVITSDQPVRNRELFLKVLHTRLEMLMAKGIPVHVQDARNYHKLSQLMVTIKPDVIVHLAAVSHANLSNKDPYSTFDHNLRTLENALDNVKTKGKHFIFFSSSMVYGNFGSEGVTEESPCEPLGIYGALKYSGEKIVKAYNQVFDLPYTIIRPSALYGERCISGRVGQKFIEAALFDEEITIAGDGSDKLDFTYIDDLVNGVILTMENENAKNQVFNLTYGEGRTLADMAGVLQEHFQDVKIKNVQKDKLMPDRGSLYVDKAKRLLGYAPSWPLEKGYSKYINWYKGFFEGKR